MPNTTPDTNGQPPKAPNNAWIREKEDAWDKKNITKTWYRLRASEAPALLDHFPTKDLDRLVSDEQRIQKTRARLLRDATKKDYLPELQTTFREWRAEACQRPGSIIKQSLAERGNPVGPVGNRLKPGLCPDFDAEKETNGDDDPSRELKAGVMFFEKCGHGWKGVTYDKGSFPKQTGFPDQKILVHDALNDKDYNPFAPTYDDKGNRHLKYIHLPANHMGVSWIRSCRPHGPRSHSYILTAFKVGRGEKSSTANTQYDR